MPDKMQELEQDMEKLIRLKLGKESDKTALYHSAMWNICKLFKKPGWMNNKLESRL